MATVKASFPLNAVNRKAIRENLLLDSTGSGVEKALFQAAESAKGPNQKVYVSRTYGPSGRLSVWIVDDGGKGSRKDRVAALREALGRVKLN